MAYTGTVTLLQTLRGEATTHVPIWIMRQAGRYLPEYRAIKERSSFEQMTRDPAVAAEITLQPLRRFPLDGAIIFSDIMTPLESLGVEVAFNPGPTIANPIRTAAQVDALNLREPIAPFVGEALRLVRAELPAGATLIGFGGAPLTLATYLVQGSGSKEYEQFRQFLRAQPAAMHALLEKLTELSIAYLTMQVQSGAQVIQLFDSWAGLHDLETYREFAVPYHARIMRALGELGVARIYFALGASHLLDAIAEIPSEGVGIDWRTPFRRARGTLGQRAIQGNLDPAVLYADGATIEREAIRVLDAARGGAHIFNLGHGIWPDTPIDSVARLVETVHRYER